jgi:hypothetical protein
MVTSKRYAQSRTVDTDVTHGMTGRKHDRPGLPADLERRSLIDVASHLKRQGQRAKALPHGPEDLQTGVRESVVYGGAMELSTLTW